jgi:phenylacetate-CoA ligase
VDFDGLDVHAYNFQAHDIAFRLLLGAARVGTQRDDLDRQGIDRAQAQGMKKLLSEVLPRSPFYRKKFAAAGLDLGRLSFPVDMKHIPFTTKAELIESQRDHPPTGDFLTEPASSFTRFHQTSGTSGSPLRWYDTLDSWTSLLDSWLTLFRVAGINTNDRLFFAFSFGPFLGFWAAFEAGFRYGCFSLAGGGMSSSARLCLMREQRATVVFCTPTYALRLAEVAAQEGLKLPNSGVRALVVAGEPGGSIAATRARIEQFWGSKVIDHYGLTETGPLGIECTANPAGLHIGETFVFTEVVDPGTGAGVAPGNPGELVVTTFGRKACPLIRYRTGDLVCVDRVPCPCGRSLLRLGGGIRGRVDDMITVRGNNLHPAALQSLLHRFPAVSEYRVEIEETVSLAVLRIEVEPHPQADGAALANQVSRAIHDELLFKAEVRAVAPGALPRPEMKAARWVRKSGSGSASEPPG